MVKDFDLPCHLLLLLDNWGRVQHRYASLLPPVNGLRCSRRDVSLLSELVAVCDLSFETQSVKFAGQGL